MVMVDKKARRALPQQMMTEREAAMNTQYTLFTEVEPFYTDLLAALAQAQHEISMMYFTFDHGE